MKPRSTAASSRPLQADVPHFYGSREDEATGLTWLVLGYVAGERLSSEEEVVQAAEWIGHFHARSVELAAEIPARSYESGTYAGFARRTSELAAPLTDHRSWLGPFCEQFAAVANELDSEPRVFLHGEYTPRNIICRLGRITPIDWESAATGPGELDLGSLLDGWPEEVVRTAAGAYVDARWPDGPPPGFDRRLELARLFTHLRWLGDNPEWTTDAESSWRFPAMREIARPLGLL